jgi:hypothetical protein
MSRTGGFSDAYLAAFATTHDLDFADYVGHDVELAPSHVAS